MDYRDHQAGVDGQHFWFKGKNKLINYLLSQACKSKDAKILNVGVGTGEDLGTIKKFGSVYVLDIDQQALDMISEYLVVEKKMADVCAIPYPDNSFDLVVAFDVMEHVQNDQKMADEIYRILKPGGTFVFTVPAFNFLYSGHDQVLHHFRRYNKKMIRPVMEKFTKISLGYWFFFLFLPAAANRLMNKKSTSLSMFRLPDWINAFFYQVLNLEIWLLKKGIGFPFGLTLYGIYKK